MGTYAKYPDMDEGDCTMPQVDGNLYRAIIWDVVLFWSEILVVME